MVDLQREGLTVFIHSSTGDDPRGHTEFVYWLGDEVLAGSGSVQTGMAFTCYPVNSE